MRLFPEGRILMPFFSRRQIQVMLDDLAFLQIPRKDLKGRLESKKVANVYGAMWELAILCQLSKLGPFEAYPTWLGSEQKPEAFTEHLFPGREAFVEVKAVSDGKLDGIEEMTKVSGQLRKFADEVRAGSGAHIGIQFHEKFDHMRRHLLAKCPIDLNVNSNGSRLRNWLSQALPESTLHLWDFENSCTLIWNAVASPLNHNMTRTIPEAGHVVENPIFRQLQSAAEQVATDNSEFLRCCILADSGSYVLSDPNKINPQQNTRGNITPSTGPYSARQIAHHFIQETSALDAVVIIYPRRVLGMGLQSFDRGHNWDFIVVDRMDREALPIEGIQMLVEGLPPPRILPKRGRDMLERGNFSPETRGNLKLNGTSWLFEPPKGTCSMKISRNLLCSLIIGETTYEEFRKSCGTENLDRLKRLMSEGYGLRGIEFVDHGQANDDDEIELKLEKDAARHKFQ
jgi:hypothetical protein